MSKTHRAPRFRRSPALIKFLTDNPNVKIVRRQSGGCTLRHLNCSKCRTDLFRQTMYLNDAKIAVADNKIYIWPEVPRPMSSTTKCGCRDYNDFP